MTTAVVLAVLGSGCGRVANRELDAGGSDVLGSIDDAGLIDTPGSSDDGSKATTITLAAGDVTVVVGAAGDEFMDSCPSGQALTGFSGAYGMFGAQTVLGELVGHCRTLHVGAASEDGYAITSTVGVAFPVRGVGTGDAFAVACPTDQVVVGIAAQSQKALDGIALQCAAVSLVASGTGWNGRLGTVTTGDFVGGTGGLPGSARCLDGQIATMAHSRVLTVQKVIAALGFGCRIVTAN
jgi:hypothetical protein